MIVRRVIVRTLYAGLCTKHQEVVRSSRVNALAVSWEGKKFAILTSGDDKAVSV